MKGIILAGGRATRLYPITKCICKQMLPIYDKPMIYYPLSMLMLAGIKEILVISTFKDIPRFEDLLGDGSDLGIDISYAVQQEPNGIAYSILIGEEFIGQDSVCLALGDNIFYGDQLVTFLQEASKIQDGALILGYAVKDPQRYGVIECDKDLNVLSLEEKPSQPKSNWVTCGMYFYDNTAVNRAKNLVPSARGELEINDLNKEYLKEGKLKVKLFGRGNAWLDTGTYESLIDASVFIKTIEERQGLKIGCIEEVAYRMQYIDKEQLIKLADNIHTSYGDYLKGLLNG
jgi:glucose-1-phosphate thymidylyltransferase